LSEDKQAGFEVNDECKIPLIVFSGSNQEEVTPADKTDDECDGDCESFNPADLMKFAWQIARGMVSKISRNKTKQHLP